jgi:type I restriction enzyme S subunit
MSNENALYELPNSWEWVKLGDICNTTSGGTPSRKNNSYFDGNIPWLKSGELENGLIKKTEEFITHEGLNESSAKIIPSGTLLIALYGATVGKLGILGIDSAINQAICAIFNPPEINLKYLFFYFLSYKENLLNARKGGAQPNISQQVINDVNFPISPLEEQKRIVAKIEELFTELDAGVELLKKLQIKLKCYRQSVLKAAVEGNLTQEWRAENQDKLEPANQLLDRILKERREKWEAEQLAKFTAQGKPLKDDSWKLKYQEPSPPDISNLPDLPNGWCWINLGNIIEDPKYGTSKKCTYESSGIGVLRIPNIIEENIDHTNIKFADFDKDEIKTYQLKEGDLLIIRSNGSLSIVGKCALVSKKDESFLFAGYLIRLRPHQNLITGKYLFYSLNTLTLRSQIEFKAKSTSGVNNINSDEIKALEVSLCSIAEQSKIVEEIELRLSVIDQIETTIQTNLKRAEKLRQSILKQAFRGKLVEQDPNDEPAAKLLERIKAEKAKEEPKRISKRKPKATTKPNKEKEP